MRFFVRNILGHFFIQGAFLSVCLAGAAISTSSEEESALVAPPAALENIAQPTSTLSTLSQDCIDLGQQYTQKKNALKEAFCGLACSNLEELQKHLSPTSLFSKTFPSQSFLNTLIQEKRFDVMYSLKGLNSNCPYHVSAAFTFQSIETLLKNPQQIQKPETVSLIQEWFEFLQKKGTEAWCLYYQESQWQRLSDVIKEVKCALLERYMPHWDELALELFKEKLEHQALASFPQDSRFKKGLTKEKILETTLKKGSTKDFEVLSSQSTPNFLCVTPIDLEEYVLKITDEDILKSFFTKDFFTLLPEEKRFKVAQHAKKIPSVTWYISPEYLAPDYPTRFKKAIQKDSEGPASNALQLFLEHCETEGVIVAELTVVTAIIESERFSYFDHELLMKLYTQEALEKHLFNKTTSPNNTAVSIAPGVAYFLRDSDNWKRLKESAQRELVSRLRRIGRDDLAGHSPTGGNAMYS